jgi:hypothetical protein
LRVMSRLRTTQDEKASAYRHSSNGSARARLRDIIPL